MVCRDGDDESRWSTFGFACVGFGDLPVSVLLEIAKGLASLLGETDEREIAA